MINFISVRIEFAGGLDYVTLRYYTLGFLAPWKSLSWIGWRDWFCRSQFSILLRALKAGNVFARASEGLDIVDLEGFGQTLRQNYSEAEY